MNQRKHTAGPWRVVKRGNQNGVRSAIITGPRHEVVRFDAHNATGLTAEQLANATLIAAAPAMLDALTYLRRLVLTHGDAEAISQVEGAIAAAERGAV